MRGQGELCDKIVVMKFLKCGSTLQLKTMNEIQRAAPLVSGVLDMLTSYDDNVRSIASAMMTIISLSGDLFAPYIDRVIKMFLDTEDSSLLSRNTLTFNY